MCNRKKFKQFFFFDDCLKYNKDEKNCIERSILQEYINVCIIY
jgi:hypothetical protein